MVLSFKYIYIYFTTLETRTHTLMSLTNLATPKGHMYDCLIGPALHVKLQCMLFVGHPWIYCF